MASDDLYSSEAWQALPFGAMERPQVAPRTPSEERREGGRGAKPAGRERAPAKEVKESAPLSRVVSALPFRFPLGNLRSTGSQRDRRF